MDSINLDPTVLAQLEQFALGVKICDDSGKLKGFFTPVVEEDLYKGFKFDVSTEELLRRERESTGRSLSEIMKDLEKLP